MRRKNIAALVAIGAGVIGVGTAAIIFSGQVSSAGKNGGGKPAGTVPYLPPAATPDPTMSPTMQPAPAPTAAPQIRRLPPMDPHRLPIRDYLVLNGRRYPVPVPVNPSLQFQLGDPGVSRRTRSVSLGVIHWSGGEPRDGSGVFNTLRQRGLACHFIIDRQGTIWQCADPGAVVGSDASSAYNRRSWGVEVVGSVRGRGRVTYPMVLRGRTVTAFDFEPAQYRALFALADANARAFNIPKVVAGPPWERLPLTVRNRFAGVVGHLHLSTQKPDPGSRPLERLGARPGWRMA